MASPKQKGRQSLPPFLFWIRAAETQAQGLSLVTMSSMKFMFMNVHGEVGLCQKLFCFPQDSFGKVRLRSFAPTTSSFSAFVQSWPHAASMSSPLLHLTVTGAEKSFKRL
jgi:hypothetical protein